MTRTPLSRSKGQRSRSTGRCVHRRVGAPQAAAAVGVRTCWPWETAATLPSARRRKARRHPQGRRGAGAYCGGCPLIMRPSSLGGGRILRRTLSVRLSVCLSVRPVIVFVYFFYSRTVLRANIQNRKTSVFAYGPASRVYFSARTEGRISYGHLGRTNLFYNSLFSIF